MNRLQGLNADREFCVTLNRTEAIDPARIIRTIDYSHPVFTRDGVAAQARHERSAAATARTTAVPTGAGDFTRTASGARCGSAIRWPARPRGRSSWRRERVCHLRGPAQPPAHRITRALVPLPGLHEPARPRRAAGAVRPPPALLGAPRRAGPVSPLRLPGRSRRSAGRVRPPAGGAADRSPARGPGAAADQPALPGSRLQPRKFLLPIRSRHGEGGRRDRRRHQHAMAPASCVRGRE